MHTPASIPAPNEYREHLKLRTLELERLERRFAHLGGIRLALFAVLAVAAWWSVQFAAFSVAWLLVPAAAFTVAVTWHGRVRRARTRAARAAAFYRNGLARVEGEWVGQGSAGADYADAHHVYAADLDLFGRGGLFELLSAARTRMGERTLADWLLAPADTGTIRRRHEAIAELRGRLDLRENWAVPGEQDEAGVHPDALLGWAAGDSGLKAAWIAPAAWALRALLIGAIALWATSGLLAPLLLVLLAELAVMTALRTPLRVALTGTENALDDLELLAELLQRIETAGFGSPALGELAGRLTAHGEPSSRIIARLLTAAQLVESRRNPILRVLDVPLLYSLHAALAAERWRMANGSAVAGWLDAIGEFEALLSIAGYAYEHPRDVFPELIEGPACFDATGLGHPLIPDDRCVRNDVRIETPTRLLLISGSNMSGKSTLLRAVGVATVLAMAGAPVRADALKLTRLQVGASIRVNDSLQEGSSRFYAEITRLRRLQELCGREPPLLFLLDEILQGTNSRDRLVGAEAIVRAFLGRGSIGLVTTHDLALTEIDRDHADRVRNLHFEDDLDTDGIKFDYRLREGVVTKSNGIALMRSIGLDV
jgi:hypothetical protein